MGIKNFTTSPTRKGVLVDGDGRRRSAERLFQVILDLFFGASCSYWLRSKMIILCSKSAKSRGKHRQLGEAMRGYCFPVAQMGKNGAKGDGHVVPYASVGIGATKGGPVVYRGKVVLEGGGWYGESQLA